MAYYNREFRVISNFVDSVLYSGSIFESFTTEEDRKLFRNGCMRYNNDRNGNQCKTDLHEFIHGFLDKYASGGDTEKIAVLRKYLNDMSDIDFREISDEYDRSTTTEPRIIYILKKYLVKKWPTINSEIADRRKRAREVAGNFVNFVKKAIIKKEAELERAESESEPGTYNMDTGAGNVRANLDDLIAEEGGDYSENGETK